MHLYGPRLGILDGRDYDPSRDFVCDRLEIGSLASHPPKGWRYGLQGKLC
jgi:hypothetical protein